MKVAFRTDASTEIGTGHAMRCLTLADGLRERGAVVSFLCRTLTGDAIPRIRESRFEVHDADTPGAVTVEWLVVDHYGLDQRYESAMRPGARKILVIDDLADRPHDCELLLDQNLHDDMETRYRRHIPARAKALTGPEFALLRKEFTRARPRVKREGSALRRLLVFFGGSDPTNETSKALLAIAKLERPDIAVEVLIGASNPHRAAIEALATTLPNASVAKPTHAISELMLRADLALGAGGTTSWERCCLGLPSITIAIAPNQVAVSRTLSNRGYQTYLGTRDSVSVDGILAALKRALANYSELATAGLRGMDLVDGHGVERVIAAMEAA